MAFTTVFTTLNSAEAELVSSRLESAGFEVCVVGELASLTLAAGGIRVQVDESQADDARALLKETEMEETETDQDKPA
jgi:hypothetical protein